MEGILPVLLVTANVGSIFEDPGMMLSLWINEFVQTVTRLNVRFVALHCQEVGGKNYEIRMQHVENFVKLLTSNEELRSFDKMAIFLDEDFSHSESFTALGNFYFLHKEIQNPSIWNFRDLKFEQVSGKNIYEGNIEDIPVKEKSKFPQDFFPECKWSRKGYLRTRWNIDGSIFDLVNIHLFHDASNFVAMQCFPSEYSVTRQKALQFVLDRFYTYDPPAPFFIFGDFNFRTDTQAVVEKLAIGLNKMTTEEDQEIYRDESSEVVLTVGKKHFSHSNHQDVFLANSGKWLKEFDKEMNVFGEQLFEFPVTFLPSYPFEENCSMAKDYMKTRCPAWCDRVLMSKSAKKLIKNEDSDSVEYTIMGKDSCMGDHKPVYLRADIISNAGMISSFSPRRSFHSAYSSLEALRKRREAFRARFFESTIGNFGDEAMACNPSSKLEWRNRSSSTSSTTSRIRLKSDPNLTLSLPRIQSHHSSSDEEWFEEVESEVDGDGCCPADGIYSEVVADPEVSCNGDVSSLKSKGCFCFKRSKKKRKKEQVLKPKEGDDADRCRIV